MGLFNNIKQWRHDREDRRFQTAYDSGYSWACAEMLLHRKHEREVYATISSTTDPFDLGAMSALREVPRQLKHPPGRRSRRHRMLPYVSLASLDKVIDKVPIPEVCCNCGDRVELVRNGEIYGKEYGDWPFAYRCVNTRQCGSHVGLHKGTDLPLGSLANRETRLARKTHKPAFFAVLKQRNAGRTEAYKWLAEQMGLPAAECHWAKFSVEQAENAGRVCRAYLAQHHNSTRKPE